MARVIFEYDAAIGMVSDSGGRSVVVGRDLVPFKPKPMEWLGTETMGPVIKPIYGMGEEVPLIGPEVKPPTPPVKPPLSAQDKFIEQAVKLRDIGFTADDIIKMKNHGII